MKYRSIEEFLEDWKSEAQDTALVFGAVSDDALAQAVVPGHRTLGRMAWHVVTAIPEMMNKTGLELEAVEEHAGVPSTAAEILEAYEAAAEELGARVAERWTDADLDVEDEMYGFQWPRGFTLKCLVNHQIHHRGQMTVLMRQAGLEVPGVYGPAYEGWAAIGAEPPSI